MTEPLRPADDPVQFARTGPPGRALMKTVIGICLDESGSMSAHRHVTIEAINGYLASQKQETGTDECYVTLFKFNTVVNRVTSLTPIQHVPDLTATTYHPNGGTALNDAVAHAVAEIDASASDADRVIVVVVTDGQENASRETTKDNLLDLIAAKEQTRRWTFVYLSASPQAFADGAASGFAAGNTVRYAAGNAGGAAANMSIATRSLRMSADTQTRAFSGSAMGADWSDVSGVITPANDFQSILDRARAGERVVQRTGPVPTAAAPEPPDGDEGG